MVIDIVAKMYDEMYQAEKKVADFILKNPTSIISMYVTEVAKASDTSEATVVRVCKHLGFTGFHQLKLTLASEYGYGEREKKDGEFQPTDVAEYLSMTSAQVLGLTKSLTPDVLEKCIELIANARNIHITGWGNSNAIAQDIAHRLTRQGKKTIVSPVADYFLMSLFLAGPGDILIAVSHSGATIHVCQALEIAKQKGMPSILITNAAESTAASIANYILSTNVKDQIFKHFGGESHLYEMLVVDILVYFLMQRCPNGMDSTDPAEIVLSQYKY
ncbi:MurR/RpiR family transcriptional regulator [Bacillota bacterium Meth-B3]|nr:MurR/RpiR family transcriptional regulator [Christensenellaceae bacterium]